MGADDEALTWPGDKPDRVASSSGKSSASSKDAPTFDEIIDPGERPQIPAGALVLFGLFAGVYLLFAVAWLIIALNPPVEVSDAFGNFMWLGSLWFATAGALVWFGSVLVLGASRSVGWRLLMLAIGAVVLIPWPYIALVLS